MYFIRILNGVPVEEREAAGRMGLTLSWSHSNNAQQAIQSLLTDGWKKTTKKLLTPFG